MPRSCPHLSAPFLCLLAVDKQLSKDSSSIQLPYYLSAAMHCVGCYPLLHFLSLVAEFVLVWERAFPQTSCSNPSVPVPPSADSFALRVLWASLLAKLKSPACPLCILRLIQYDIKHLKCSRPTLSGFSVQKSGLRPVI